MLRLSEFQSFDFYSHTFQRGGKILLPEEHRVAALTRLQDVTHSCLAKPAKPYSQLRFDIDLRAPRVEDVPQRLYSKQWKKAFRAMSSIISKYSDGVGYISMRDTCRVDGDLIKDGFHIHYPYVYTNESTYTVLVNEITEVFRSKGIFKDSPNCVDNVYRLNWFILGACKFDKKVKQYMEPYKLGEKDNKVVAIRDTIIFVEKPNWTDFDVSIAFDEKIHTKIDIEEDIIFDIKDNVPFVPSVPVGNIQKASEIFNKRFGTTAIIEATDSGYKITSNDLCFACFCGDQSRVIHSTPGHSCIFINNSKSDARCFNPKHTACDVPTDLILETRTALGYKHAVLTIDELIFSPLQPFSADMAEYFLKWLDTKAYRIKCYNESKLSIIYQDPKTNIWKNDQEGTFLKQLYRSNFYKFLKPQLIEHVQSKDRVVSLTKLLRSRGGILNTLKDAVCMRYDPEFESNLREKYRQNHVNNLCYPNGILNLVSGEFRPILKNDAVLETICVTHDYKTANSEIVKELLTYVSRIFPIDTERDMFLTMLATSLSAYKTPWVNILVGNGGNGKSALNTILAKGIGRHLAKQINEVSSISGPNPEICNLSDARQVVMAEPDKIINVNSLKLLTGQTAVAARRLYSNSTDGTNLQGLSIFIELNELPNFSTADGGLLRRVLVHPFRSKFVEIVSNNAEQYTYPACQEFRQKIESGYYNFSIIQILIPYYRKYVENGYNVDISEGAKKLSRTTCELNDDFLQCIQDFTENTEQENDKLSLADLHYYFSESRYFNSMSSRNRRRHGKALFCQKIKDHYVLGKYVKSKTRSKEEKSIKGKYYLTGFKIATEYKLSSGSDSDED